MKEFNLLDHIRNDSDGNIVIWIFNIGVEKCWNNGTGIVKDPNEDIVVNHVEEINLLITKKQDCMIMRKRPTEAFLKELDKKGYEVPNIICPSCEDETKSISELTLEDDALLEKLRLLGQKANTYFVPYGVSEAEEKIAEICGLHLIGGTNDKSKAVNNKIFSKKVARDLALPTADEVICRSAEEIRTAYEKLSEKYSRIIVKMPCNSSGQGMWIIDNEKKLNTVYAVINRISRTQKVEEWLAEGWIEKQMDLNLQVYVSENGYVETFSVKEQIVEETLYIGSVISAGLSEQQYKKCLEYGNKIGEYLYSLGYSGVFGIDALVAKDGTIVPIIEINGRFTLSTYVSFITMRYPEKYLYAFYKRLQSKALEYERLKKSLEENDLWLTESKGIWVYNAATVDSHLASGRVRIFCLAVGENRESVDEMVDKFTSVCEEYIL